MEIVNPWFAELAQSIQQVLNKRTHNLLLNINNYNAEQDEQFLDGLCRDKTVAGLLAAPLIGLNPPVESYQRLRRAGIPFVFVSHDIPGIEADYVVIDSQAGAYEAVSHLIQLGHRQIGFVGCEAPTIGLVQRRRYQGYVQALSEHGLTPLPYASFMSVRQDVEAGYRAMAELLQHDFAPDCHFGV